MLLCTRIPQILLAEKLQVRSFTDNASARYMHRLRHDALTQSPESTLTPQLHLFNYRHFQALRYSWRWKLALATQATNAADSLTQM